MRGALQYSHPVWRMSRQTAPPKPRLHMNPHKVNAQQWSQVVNITLQWCRIAVNCPLYTLNLFYGSLTPFGLKPNDWK